MSNITDLRAILFDTLNRLKTGDIEADQAREINNLSQTIINSAKVEIDYLRVTGGNGTGFIPDAQTAVGNSFAGLSDKTIELPNGVRVVQHKLRG